MRNLSENGEDITLNLSKTYFIMDALYLNKVRKHLCNLNRMQLEKEIISKVFPYTYAPFAKMRFNNSDFKVSQIRKAHEMEIEPNSNNFFSSDTGLIIIIEESLVTNFILNFEYDKLANGINNVLNLDYWAKITSQYNKEDIGLILAPGINSDYEFVGGGLYKVLE